MHNGNFTLFPSQIIFGSFTVTVNTGKIFFFFFFMVKLSKSGHRRQDALDDREDMPVKDEDDCYSNNRM